jgi:hypothetical protein
MILEGLWQHTVSPIQALRGLQDSLQQLLSAPERMADLDWTNTCYLAQVQSWRQADAGPRHPARARDLYAALHPSQPLPATTVPPQLSPALRQTLHDVLRNYLTRRLLNFNLWQAQTLTLFQFLCFQGLSLLSIQTELLTGAHDDVQTLLATITRFEARVSQNPDWFARYRFNQWDEQTCLDALRDATEFDLCLP